MQGDRKATVTRMNYDKYPTLVSQESNHFITIVTFSKIPSVSSVFEYA